MTQPPSSFSSSVSDGRDTLPSSPMSTRTILMLRRGLTTVAVAMSVIIGAVCFVVLSPSSNDVYVSVLLFMHSLIVILLSDASRSANRIISDNADKFGEENNNLPDGNVAFPLNSRSLTPSPFSLPALTTHVFRWISEDPGYSLVSSLGNPSPLDPPSRDEDGDASPSSHQMRSRRITSPQCETFVPTLKLPFVPAHSPQRRSSMSNLIVTRQTSFFPNEGDVEDLVRDSPSTPLTPSTPHLNRPSRVLQRLSTVLGIEKPSSTYVMQKTLNWKKGKSIGRGAFGDVHLGLNQDTGELMAVKRLVFDPTEKDLGKKLQMLQNEITILKKLDHENIVRYFFAERVENGVNVFMEYVSGGSISQVLQNFGPLDEHVVVQYTHQILLGLSYLHRNHVVHSDVKGANLLVTVEGIIKLADFGCATIAEQRAVNDRMTGTPVWMAPEVVREENTVGWASDIWSLGCTVMEMLTGKPPWSHIGAALEVMNYITDDTRPLELPPGLSEGAVGFLSDCLRRKPSDRPTAEQLLQHHFFYEAETFAEESSQHPVVMTPDPIFILPVLAGLQKSTFRSCDSVLSLPSEAFRPRLRYTRTLSLTHDSEIVAFLHRNHGPRFNLEMFSEAEMMRSKVMATWEPNCAESSMNSSPVCTPLRTAFGE